MTAVVSQLVARALGMADSQTAHTTTETTNVVTVLRTAAPEEEATNLSLISSGMFLSLPEFFFFWFGSFFCKMFTNNIIGPSLHF